MGEIIGFLYGNDYRYIQNVATSKLTGIYNDGILPLVVYPNSILQLKLLIRKIFSLGLSFEVLGALTNTYLTNTFKRDVVVLTTQVKDKIQQTNSVIVGCGYNLTKLAKEMSSNSVTMFEGFIGIPGTVGAAAINNSGAFDSSMSKVVNRVLCLDRQGQERWIDNSDLGFSLRSSKIKRKELEYYVLAVEFTTEFKDTIVNINERINAFLKIRRSIIDGKRKSLGSVFVSKTLFELWEKNKIAFLIKKIVNVPFKLFFHSPRINTYLDFFFLGRPSMAKYCDSLNRFCWDSDTVEEDFLRYINFMMKKSGNKLKLEIEIKE